MQIGKYIISEVICCEFGLDGGAMFGIVPQPLWKKKFPPDDQSRISMVTRSMVISGNNKLIVVDAGFAPFIDEKTKIHHKVTFPDGDVEHAFKKAGINPNEVTDVILTHLHFDHAPGVLKKQNDTIIPLFPNARHHVHEKAWHWSYQPTIKDRGSFTMHGFTVLKEQNLLVFHDGNYFLDDHISIKISNGHTIGLQMIAIEEEGLGLVYTSDLIPTSAHVSVPWVMAYDLQPLVTIEEKQVLLGEMVSKNYWMCFEHDPHVAAAKIIDKNGKYTTGEQIEKL